MLSTRRITTLLAKVQATISSILQAKLPSSYQTLAKSPNPDTSFQTRRRERLVLRRLLAYAAGFFCLVVAFAVYTRDDILSVMTSAASPANIPKDEFIDAVLRSPVEGVLDPEPILKKCNATKFQEGLVWHCGTIVGGIGNVGNMWLNCVRYAIEAGATTLILPRLGARASNLVDLGGEGNSVELSSLFDIAYFLDSWKQACPQMNAFVSDSEIPNLPPLSSARSPHLSPANVKSFDMRKYLIIDPTGWREAFDSWLGKIEGFSTMSAEEPIRVSQDMVLAQWNRERNPRDFANSFPRLFQYPSQTRRLAASALWSLEKKLGRPAVADSILFSALNASSNVNSLGPHRLASSGFFGAHARLAADATAAGWPGYDAQVPFYLAEAKRLNLTTIYLATGSPEHLQKIRSEAEREGLSVIVKEDLLDEEELAELQILTWDQQALVDFDVLMHSSWFYGAVRSSFSWSIALRRSLLPEAEGTSRITEDDEYRDDLSAIVGRYPNINPEGMWP